MVYDESQHEYQRVKFYLQRLRNEIWQFFLRLPNSMVQQIEESNSISCRSRSRRSDKFATWIWIDMRPKRNFWWMGRNERKIGSHQKHHRTLEINAKGMRKSSERHKRENLRS